MKRSLVIGDIHGGLKALEQVLKKAQITPDDTLIFLGDYVDGWSDTPKVIDFLIQLKKSNSCIFIKGNHDIYLLDYLKNNIITTEWLPHGGAISIENYKNVPFSTRKAHIQFLEELEPYYLDKENRLFIHAGFTHMRGINHEYNKKSFYFDRTLWETAVCMDTSLVIDSPLYPRRLKLYKEVFIGHTPTLYINSTVPTQKINIWNVDTGAAFTGKISVLNIDTKEFWQSDSLPSLYPNEKGRNAY